MLRTQASCGCSGYESNVVRSPNEDVAAVPQTSCTVAGTHKILQVCQFDLVGDIRNFLGIFSC